MLVAEAHIADQTGVIRAIWFNQPYIANALRSGMLANFAGKVQEDDGELYLYEPSRGDVRAFASDVKDFVLNTDRTMVATLERSAIEVFSFKDEDEYWRFAPPQAHLIKKLLWHKDSEHLFVVYPERTRLLDITDAALENFEEVAESSLVEYDEEDNSLFFIKDDRLREVPFSS